MRRILCTFWVLIWERPLSALRSYSTTRAQPCPRPDQAFLKRLIDYGIATGYLRAQGSAHVGIVPLQPFAKAEPPAYSDLEIDTVRPQRAPGGDPAIGGDHHAVDKARAAKPVEAEAQIRLLHDQQRGVAATDSQEIGAAEEHGVRQVVRTVEIEETFQHAGKARRILEATGRC